MSYDGERRVEQFVENSNSKYASLEAAGLEYPQIVLSQGILETGWFNPTNPIFAENHNWLGLKCAQYRKTYCIGTRYGHAIFKSDVECLLDYIEWQNKYMPRYESKYGKIASEEDYYDFLLKWKYAEDENYIRKLKRIRKFLT